MALPVLPPILPAILLTLEAAPDTIFPALDCTRLRPSDALDAVLDAVSLALLATSEAVSFAFEAVSAVVEADLNLLRRKRSRDCRSSVGGAGEGGIVMLS